ncbi:PilN domain-containing protein [uncultured Tenacibaculum sp.]|uniref:PilN domain-containing protein n=1 Tax=uncultured Tenacibaculum sp. TaxID=174713 RepID=UPI00260D6E12|nr:PilN domain-containing protein [uncultured Tenacibaculum sp.]
MLKKRLTYGLVYTAIEHSSNASNNEEFVLLSLVKKGKELLVKNRSFYSSYNKLLSSFEKEQHVFLVLNNHQVLSKKIDVINNSHDILTKKAFPNINLNDFYFEVYSTKKASFVSICRKEYVDNLIHNYKKKKVSVIGFSLGVLVVQNILQFLDDGEVQTSISKIQIKKGELNEVEKTTSEKVLNYSINNLEVVNNELLCLGGILSYYFGKDNQLGLAKKNHELREAYNQQKIFSLGLKGGVVFLFLVLLTNFIFFNHYYTKNNQLLIDVQLNDSYKNQLLKLQSEIKQKEKVIANLSSVSRSKVSLYLDDIAILIPNTITLTSLEYQPLSTRVKKEKLITTYKNQIQIKGVLSSNEDFTKFIRFLENKEWVDKVIIQLGEEKRTATFEILIHLRHE